MRPFLLILPSFALACFAIGGDAGPEKKPANTWSLLDVPGAWQDAPGGKFAKHDGFAWYRCFVKVPAAWKGDDLSLTVHKIGNCHEAYFNGVKMGGQGSFPPNYQSGPSELPASYTIAGKHVRSGEYNVLAVRIVNREGKGGFRGAPPILGNETQAIALKGPWQFRTGDNLDWAKEKIDGKPKAATFLKVENAAEVTRRFYPGKGPGPLAPAEAVKRFKVAGGLVLEQVLAEPVVRQPVHISFDERGRMWVVQYLQYPNPAGLKLVSRDRYWRAIYDKVPPPPPHHFPGKDKITIHQDTKGNGVFDKHTTFVEGLNIATAVARGRDGVWVLNPPYLLFYPDKNNDDIPDRDPEVHLEGFGLEDTHSVVNNLCWGPDGWLYGAQGSTVSARVRVRNPKSEVQISAKEADKKEPETIRSMGQLIWRYQPETRRYEIFAEGGGNAFGLEIDSKGRIFSGHNGGNTRGFHYVQGGYYQKGFSKHGPISNPYAFGYFPYMTHPNVPRFTHAFVKYEGSAFPRQHDGKLFAVAPLQGLVVESDIVAHASSFQTKDVDNIVTTSDPWFRPVAIKDGPDGALYIADFYEAQIAHLRHFEGQIHTDSGRIYRLRPMPKAEEKLPNEGRPKTEDLGKLSTRELIKRLESPNRWTRQTALRLIGDRKDRSVVPHLKNLIHDKSGQLALEALWAVNLCGGLDDALALQTLDHADPHVRLWTVRLLGDRNEVSGAIAAKLAKLAAAEPNVEVRSQLACSARRLPAEACLPIVRRLLARNEDVDDVHLPLLLWWAIESKADTGRDLIRQTFTDPVVWRLPLVERHILERLMRRYAQAGGQKNYRMCAELLRLAPEKQHAAKLLAGFEQAFAGRSLANLPDELVREMARRGGGSLALRLRLGEPAAVDEALSLVADEKADKNKRLDLIPILGQIKTPRAAPALLSVVASAKADPVRQAALAALQSFDGARIAEAVIDLYPKLPDDVRSAARNLLVSRKEWTRHFLDAVESGKIPAKAVPLETVRRMTVHKDEAIAKLVSKHWGKVQGATTEEMRKQIARLEQVVRKGEGSPYPGKKLFLNTCAKCHTLFGQGGAIGPDLTTYKRDDLASMLLHIVNPSAEIREGYETSLIVTTDGRTLTGFVVDQDNRAVVLRSPDGQDVTLAKSAIESQRIIPQSLMPEGLLDTLSEQQVRDLFAYLRISQPLND